MNDQVLIAFAMMLYMSCVIGIGIYYYKRANQSSEEFFLGGRQLGPWVTAMSAEASDMSGYLLMGIPGVAYWFGLADAFWTALGLAIGTYINWLIVAKRLRIYSHIAGDSITIPDFISHRFKEAKPRLLLVSAIFIIIFFTVYASSCFVTVGKLFSNLFGLPYITMMIFGGIFVLFYTFIGGFLAESASDFMQGIVMVLALTLVVGLGLYHAGGIGNVIENARSIPGFLEFFGISQPVMQDGSQLVQDNAPVFGDRAQYGILAVLSTMSWGLGYFGVPQVLLRFMAIRDSEEIKYSRRIAVTWVFISLFSAVAIGIIGRTIFPVAHGTASASEHIFSTMASSFLPPFLAGLVLAGILAATISSSDSYLLIAASALAKNIYQGILKKDASEKAVMKMSRIVLLLITIVAMMMATDEQSIIFSIVSIAWAGFGAAFGPVILTSLFWRDTTANGALAGMLVGGSAVIIWNLFLADLGGFFDLYELLPCFLLALISIIVVSKLDKKDPAVQAEYDLYQETYQK